MRRWLDYKHDETRITDYKYDGTPFWETTGRKLFPGLSVIYYRTATKHLSEAMVERFFLLLDILLEIEGVLLLEIEGVCYQYGIV